MDRFTIPKGVIIVCFGCGIGTWRERKRDLYILRILGFSERKTRCCDESRNIKIPDDYSLNYSIVEEIFLLPCLAICFLLSLVINQVLWGVGYLWNFLMNKGDKKFKVAFPLRVFFVLNFSTWRIIVPARDP